MIIIPVAVAAVAPDAPDIPACRSLLIMRGNTYRKNNVTYVIFKFVLLRLEARKLSTIAYTIAKKLYNFRWYLSI